MDQEQIREVIAELLTDADTTIIQELRGTRDVETRMRLCNELDALERVRERFYAKWGT